MANLYRTTKGQYEPLAEFSDAKIRKSSMGKAMMKARVRDMGLRGGSWGMTLPGTTGGSNKKRSPIAFGATGGKRQAKSVLGNWAKSSKRMMAGHTMRGKQMIHTGKTGPQPLHAKGVAFTKGVLKKAMKKVSRGGGRFSKAAIRRRHSY